MEKPFAITLDVGSSLANKTGSWRTERAVHVDRLPPCNHACPAGENIQQWLYNAEEGGQGYERGWRQIMEDNPFPAIMGRVCYHPCETSCNRGQLDEAVGINSVERFLGDEAIEQGWKVDPPATTSGKRVLVVGAGPSGLSAAYHLTRLGHDVSIHEAGPMSGGMMRFGIPKYRLPRDVLDAEVQRILEMGVTLELNRKVTNVEESMKDGGFDAAFLAVGAHISKRTYIPAGESAHILDALSVLRSMEGEEQPMLGRRVVVYGGGNTAMDVARTAKRLGAAEAVVVYRRTRERMPAHDFEVEEAQEEGVLMRWLSTIKQADEGKLLIEKMELDETGFPQPTGEIEELEADSVVLALGQDTDLSLLDDVAGIEVEDGVVAVAPNMMTGHPGIFAGGDMVPDERTVTVGIGHGKKAARHIDGWLRGQVYEPPPKHELVTFDMLNTWYYADAPRTVQPQLDPIRRQGTFDEVVQGLDESNALFEARRCLSCGNCFSCDNCYGVCPDNAVLKLSEAVDANVNGYAIDLDFCKGCGLCVAECPSGAIRMEPEAI
jgi:NADPH-dependent glutamate synthase beta subunit-like oxidoreductase